jgi:hypothetical protein
MWRLQQLSFDTGVFRVSDGKTHASGSLLIEILLHIANSDRRPSGTAAFLTE